ncbi:CRISPR-associated endonuclease Cas3'' [Erythrobacter cryptus]|uniref:CRISPR-associated endonuclease Cas3'' n=1 Tax=Erythrobacter cryptus TaxID=196588 RepID=UPI0012EB89D5|nr:CRISPR-associated endonuclease Cas3'' [Erythrobacter cryptus]
MFAHSIPGRPEDTWEPLTHHLRAVGERAAGFAAHFSNGQMARAMGLLHDIGKCSDAYQRYIRQDDSNRKVRGPDHSSAGAQEAVKAFGAHMGRLMAYGIAGHHGGLMDSEDLSDRLVKPLEAYDGWCDHVGELPSAEELSGIRLAQNGIDRAFSLAFLARMTFSCLVDADFLETERFYRIAAGEDPPSRGGTVQHHHLEAVRAHMARCRRDDTEVNRLRSAILDHANGKAALPPGLFTLTVPTGGGKTLTSLSFALEHALAHGLRRVIYVIPFTSIIEQTAAVFRDEVALGEAVLEHHSSFDWDSKPPETGNDAEGEGAAGLAKLRRDAENWDAPIIVTTAVQFFESVFAARPSQARKLHNLAKSVIVLDEAQSIPVHLLRPCMAVIDELARNYGASVILCTATQPALRLQDKALPATPEGRAEGLDIPAERELAPDPQALYRKLKRVEVEWLREPVTDEEIAARFAQQPQMLCIVNSRGHARDLFALLREQGQAGAMHLSTLMCARHRRAVLDKVREGLKAGQPVRLISTSLIEAGVDVDFPEVWRAAAGLASIAQAAGRCNREGRAQAMGRTVVFEAAGRKMPPAIEAFYAPAREVMRREGLDVLGLEAIRDYYEALYWRQQYEALDRARLPGGEALAIIPAIRELARQGDFPFATIARAFRLIDDAMDPVIVPYDDAAREAIHDLAEAPFPPAGVQRRLQQYVVPVPAKVREALVATGAVQAIRPDEYGDRFMVLVEEQKGQLPGLYDPQLGLRIDCDPASRSAEANIFS